MIYRSLADVPWDPTRWANFSPAELGCRHCGEYYHDEESLDAIQALRGAMGGPLIITSAHRCAIHNARVGGAPLSMHKKLAFDVLIGSHHKGDLIAAAELKGFRGIGVNYRTFVHVDMGPRRRW